MAAVVSREAYFANRPRRAIRPRLRRTEAGRGVQPPRRHDRVVLSLLLRLACLYRELLENWMKERTVLVIEFLKNETDPRRRIDSMVQVGLELPHGAEAAIRAWSSLDPDVYDIQVKVDQQRFDIMYSSALELLQNITRRRCSRDGRSICCRPRTVDASAGHRRAGMGRQAATDALDRGRFASVPTDD